MIDNATLTRLDTPGPPTPGGSIPFTTGSAVSVRCTLDDPMAGQRLVLGAVIQDATAVAYVLKAGYPAGLAQPARGQRLTVRIDDGTPQTYRVLYVRDRVKDGGQSHWECYLTSNL